VRELHQHMFGETWSWAGSFRKSNKNIGVEWQQVGVKLRDLLSDARYQIDHATYPPDEIARALSSPPGSDTSVSQR